jgi:glycosyltransferase involved in cell wall biosynthesis
VRIGVDAREIQAGVVTGIGRSLANFVHYFSQHDTEHTLVLFSENVIPLNFIGKVDQVVVAPQTHVLIWDQWKLFHALRVHQIDLFYSPYYKVPLLTNIPVVSQILDLMYLVFPPYRSALGIHGRLYYRFLGRACARKATSILTDSEHAKRDIIRLWKIDPQKITVIPLGIGTRYRPITEKSVLENTKKKFQLPEQFILYLGNFKPHKNVAALVQAFHNIEKRFPEYKLVLAGPMDRYGQQLKETVGAAGLSDRILFTDTIREEDCPEALLTLSDLFVFPTLYEGFGLPPLEAMACGTPVIAGKLTAVPEVVGDTGVLVNPHDINEISEAIADLLDNPHKRNNHAQKGLQRVKQFAEEKTAGEIYRHLLNFLETKQ